ncbi:MAG: polymerase sigma factor SigL [Verrucomicrobiales bacterium]|jgi:hypothetical protein|nr:polymerase sigma factor SigL [Verrucomicrobiales bacterium]
MPENDSQSADELLPVIYSELRKLALAKIAQQGPGQTLQATALVHEAWLKLGGDHFAKSNGREHFFRACAGDSCLRDEVEALIQAHEAAGGFLEQKPNTQPSTENNVTERPGTFIGRCKLIEHLGEGGCGLFS